MIKVCHFTSVHKRYDQRIFLKECVSLAVEGYDTYLIVNDNLPNEKRKGVKIISTSFVPNNRVERIIKTKQIMLTAALKINADIYHFHDPELLPVGLNLKKRGKKVIFDSHENYSMQMENKPYLPKFTCKILSILYPRYETYVTKRLDAVVFPCTFGGKNPFEGRAQKTVFVGNPPVLDELYNKYQKKERKESFKICYIGSLEYVRGIKHLILACYKVGVKLILAGNFTTAEFESDVRSMKAFSCVDYRGFVDRIQLLEIFQEVSAGACTLLSVGQHNKEDIFSTKVYEYMSVGIPVIISDYIYARNVMKTYPFGITVDPTNVKQIERAILEIMENTKLSNELGYNGRKAIKELFNWDIEKNNLLQLYDSLL